MMETGMELMMLGICTVTDLRRRKIWWPIPVFIGIAALICHAPLWRENWIREGYALIPGMCFCLLALLPSHPVGVGDGLTLLALGMLRSLSELLELLMLALLFCTIWAIVLLVTKKRGRRAEIPFLPFLLAAKLCLMIL